MFNEENDYSQETASDNKTFAQNFFNRFSLIMNTKSVFRISGSIRF